MYDEFGRELAKAVPSTPVVVAGWRESLPTPGERILQLENERKAQQVARYRLSKEINKKVEQDWVSYVALFHRAICDTIYYEIARIHQKQLFNLFLFYFCWFQKIAEERIESDRKEYLENRRKLLDAGVRIGSTLRLVAHKVGCVIIFRSVTNS